MALRLFFSSSLSVADPPNSHASDRKMARELIALLLLAALFNLSSAVGTEDSGEQGELIFAQLVIKQ